jgi:hypothetical protein
MARGPKSSPSLPLSLLLLPSHLFADWYKDVLDDLRDGRPLDKAVKETVRDLLRLQTEMIDEAREVRYKAVEVQSKFIERYRALLDELEKQRNRRAPARRSRSQRRRPRQRQAQ